MGNLYRLPALCRSEVKELYASDFVVSVFHPQPESKCVDSLANASSDRSERFEPCAYTALNIIQDALDTDCRLCPTLEGPREQCR